MVCEHNKRGFEGAWLSETFGYLTLGNGFVAGAFVLVSVCMRVRKIECNSTDRPTAAPPSPSPTPHHRPQ